MAEYADFETIAQDGGGAVIRFSRCWAIAAIGDLDDRLRAVDGPVERLDLSAVTHLDTVGAWIIYRTSRDHHAAITGANAGAQSLIRAVSGVDHVPPVPERKTNPLLWFVSELGASILLALQSSITFLGFLGQGVKAAFALIRNPRRFRIHSVMQHLDHVAIRALGIVGLMNFLIGIVIAQQGAIYLREFGVEIYTIDLIARLTFRELGVLMTAIMIAGRSGSAFAAQIGSMKVAEEIDAMRVIGVSPMEALVIPRVLATIVMMPLVSLFASLMAVIGGGLLCWTLLHIPPSSFVDHLRNATPMRDFYICMIKAPVFGAIIAMAGCFQGMQVEGNSEQVGLRTTAAVVQSIFLVIVLDAFFAVFFEQIGWK